MRFPLFGVGQRGKSPNVTAQSRNNLYLDVQPQEDKTQISLHSRPALSLFAEFGDEPIRGTQIPPVDDPGSTGAAR